MKIVGILLLTVVCSVITEKTFDIDGIGYWISDPIQKKWSAAFRDCYQRGMYLIDFETLEEYHKVNKYLQDYSFASESYWTSGTAVGTKGKNEFYWAITGATVQINGFGPGQPDNAARNEYCLAMQRQLGFQWNDASCRDTKSFICRATRYFKLQQHLSPDPIRL